jgi:hypothetical protein
MCAGGIIGRVCPIYKLDNYYGDSDDCRGEDPPRMARRVPSGDGNGGGWA